MKYIARDDGLRIPNDLWEIMQYHLKITDKKNHPLGCHRMRLSDRVAMDGVLFVLRKKCYWNALSTTNICSSSTAHRRFKEWREAGVFECFIEHGLVRHDFLRNIDWSFLKTENKKIKKKGDCKC